LEVFFDHFDPFLVLVIKVLEGVDYVDILVGHYGLLDYSEVEQLVLIDLFDAQLVR